MTLLTVVAGDIASQQVDVIVNAANASLSGGGGVDGAIHRAAGPALVEACHALRQKLGTRPCAVGQALLTEAGNLPALYVVHTVGPTWEGGGEGEAELLASCYHQSLQRALEVGARTLAFPSISTGAYRYPFRLAAQVAVATVRAFPKLDSFSEIRFVVFSPRDLKYYQEVLESSG